MIIYKVISETTKYQVLNNEKLVASAVRKLNFFGHKIIFYDADEEEIIRVKEYYFLIFGFGYKITFLKEGISLFLRKKWGRLELKYNNDIYTLKYNLFSVNENLYLNGELEGKYKVIKNKLISFDHEISCNNENSCFIFSVLDIVQHNYNAN